MKKGFTLIELLVVIAIIGVLASIILSSLNSARLKGQDAKTKEQLSGLEKAAAIYYDDNNTYNTTGVDVDDCASDMFADSASGMSSYTDQANYSPGATLSCHASAAGDSYAVSALLLSQSGAGCVDSLGALRQIPANLSSGEFLCP